MPTSAPGSRRIPRLLRPSRPPRAPHSQRRLGPSIVGGAHPAGAAGARGFTLLELLVVLAIIAVSAGLATLALRDGNATRLEREAVRLAALLEMARAEARVSGSAVRWVPGAEGDAPGVRREDAAEGPPPAFRFVGLGSIAPLPRHWLDERVVAVVPPPGFVVLGPDAILPPQRLTLQLEDQRIEIASDGLSPFAIASPGPAEPTGAAR